MQWAIITDKDLEGTWAGPGYIWVYKCTPIILGEKLQHCITRVYLTLHLCKSELSFTISLVLYTHYLQSSSANGKGIMGMDPLVMYGAFSTLAYTRGSNQRV
jgi:hypothetical protein